MNVITRHDSHTIVYTSADATLVDPVFGNGKFTCHVSNVNRGGTHAVKVVPTRVLIPNVFYNVLAGATFVGVEKAGGGATTTIDPGFYTIENLLARIETVSGEPLVVFGYDTSTNRVFIENGTPDIWTVTLSLPIAVRMGFINPTIDGTGNAVIAVPANTTVFATASPFMGTTPVVHVVAKKIATNNLLSSNNGEYNVLTTVDMTQTPFGQYASFSSQDIFLHDIDFRSPRQISDVDFELVDNEFQTLTIDPRFHVVVALKVYHTDTQK